METKIEIWKVRGIEGVCFASKLAAEEAARDEFPEERADYRYARIYFNRLAGGKFSMRELRNKVNKACDTPATTRGPMPPRLHTDRPFYGCVDKDGTWFDSSEIFDTAVHWCCYDAGAFDLGIEGEREWMENEGKKRGYSIVHSDMLRKMWDAGLLK